MQYSKLIFSTVVAFSATLGIGAASAGDVGAKARRYVAPAPVYNWSGFYVGGDIGGVSQANPVNANYFQTFAGRPDLETNPQTVPQSSRSVTGGIRAGYNWQFGSSFLIGVEADAQWLNPKFGYCRQTYANSIACNDTGAGFMTVNGEGKWLSTVRERLGWTFDRFMIYATGGIAFGAVNTTMGFSCLVNGCGSSTNPIATSGTVSSTKTGWVAGGGIEWMMTSTWLLRAEYLHADLGNVAGTVFLPLANCHDGIPCGGSFARNVTYDIGRLGISYKFGG